MVTPQGGSNEALSVPWEITYGSLRVHSGLKWSTSGYGWCMTATTMKKPPRSTGRDSDQGPTGAPRLKVGFSGTALRSLLSAARQAGLAPAEYVRRAVKGAIYLQKMQSQGYQVVCRNSAGAEFLYIPELVLD